MNDVTDAWLACAGLRRHREPGFCGRLSSAAVPTQSGGSEAWHDSYTEGHNKGSRAASSRGDLASGACLGLPEKLGGRTQQREPLETLPEAQLCDGFSKELVRCE